VKNRFRFWREGKSSSRACQKKEKEKQVGSFGYTEKGNRSKVAMGGEFGRGRGAARGLLPKSTVCCSLMKVGCLRRKKRIKLQEKRSRRSFVARKTGRSESRERTSGGTRDVESPLKVQEDSGAIRDR